MTNLSSSMHTTKSPQGFEILPPAADLKTRVHGSTVQELFRHALSGAAFLVSPDAFKQVKSGRKILAELAVEAVDINSLLIEFLSRAIARAEAEGAVFTDAAFRAFGENFLEAELSGVDAGNAVHEIRGVSYEEVDIKKNPATGFFETVLVFEK